MTTLSDLVSLLTRCPADSPAMLRLPESERTVVGLAKAYLPPHLFVRREGAVRDRVYIDTMDLFWRGTYMADVLHVETVGIGHAVVVALALALGLDPGVGGVSCLWEHAGECWMLTTSERTIVFEPEDEEHGIAAGDVTFACLSWICAPTVALEPDPIKALCLAVRCILETP